MADADRQAQDIIGLPRDSAGLQAITAVAERQIAEALEISGDLPVVINVETTVVGEGVEQPRDWAQQRLRCRQDFIDRVILAVVHVADKPKLSSLIGVRQCTSRSPPLGGRIAEVGKAVDAVDSPRVTEVCKFVYSSW